MVSKKHSPEEWIVRIIALILLIFAGCKLVAIEAPTWLVAWLSRLL